MGLGKRKIGIGINYADFVKSMVEVCGIEPQTS